MSSFLTRGTKENRAATEESDEGRKEDYLTRSQKSILPTRHRDLGTELNLVYPLQCDRADRAANVSTTAALQKNKNKKNKNKEKRKHSNPTMCPGAKSLAVFQ